jgi:hypothetical protein
MISLIDQLVTSEPILAVSPVIVLPLPAPSAVPARWIQLRMAALAPPPLPPSLSSPDSQKMASHVGCEGPPSKSASSESAPTTSFLLETLLC